MLYLPGAARPFRFTSLLGELIGSAAVCFAPFATTARFAGSAKAVSSWQVAAGSAADSAFSNSHLQFVGTQLYAALS